MNEKLRTSRLGVSEDLTREKTRYCWGFLKKKGREGEKEEGMRGRMKQETTTLMANLETMLWSRFSHFKLL